MRLPPTVDPHVRNELLKVDKFLRQVAPALANSIGSGNHPGAGFNPIPPPPTPITGGLIDHNHSMTGQGGNDLGVANGLIRGHGTWWHDYRVGINKQVPSARLHVVGDGPVTQIALPTTDTIIPIGWTYTGGGSTVGEFYKHIDDGPSGAGTIAPGEVICNSSSLAVWRVNTIVDPGALQDANWTVSIEYKVSLGTTPAIVSLTNSAGTAYGSSCTPPVTLPSAAYGLFVYVVPPATVQAIRAAGVFGAVYLSFVRNAGITLTCKRIWISTPSTGVGGTTVLIDQGASQEDPSFNIRNASLRNLLKVTGATVDLGNGTDSTTRAMITFGQGPTGGGTGPTHAKISWGDNNNALSDPNTTADVIGVVGARLYLYKDPAGLFDAAYGQSLTEAWVLVSDSSIPYAVYTGTHPLAPYKRVEWSGVGDQINYGRIAIRKSLGAGGSIPELRLEETGAGTNYTAFRAAAAITTDHTYVFPAALANGLFNNLVSGSTGTLSMLTAVRGDLLYGNATPAWAKLPIGGAGTVLTSNGTDVSWAAPSGVGTHVILDSTVHTDTLTSTVLRGSLIAGNATPKWAQLGIGAAGTVLKSNGTDPAWGTLAVSDLPDRTRTEELPVDTFTQANGTAMTFGFVGTYPNRYKRWNFVTAPGTAPQGIYRMWQVPQDYVSGGRVILEYTTQDAINDDNTWEARVRYFVINNAAEDAIGSQVGLTGVATTIVKVSTQMGLLTLPTPRAIQSGQAMARLDMGADMTGLSAGQWVRLNIERNVSSASDLYADAIDLVAVYITYTADM